MEAIWIVPPAMALIGIAGFSMAALVSRRFDRKYPHLSRKGLWEAEERERASVAMSRRAPIPVPPFRPDEWRMRSARRESESERLDRSLAHLGAQVMRRPKRPEMKGRPADR